MNNHKNMVLKKIWMTKQEELELFDKLDNLKLRVMQGDGLNVYLRICDLIKQIYERGDL